MSSSNVEHVNLLVVDDHPENLLAMEATLSTLGQRVVTASSGQEALRCLLHEDYACILLDVQMPGMDGFETAALIRQRERSRHIPIIFLTAIHRNEVQVARGYSLGAVDYLFKPIVPDILRSKVAVFIDLHQKALDIRRQADRLHELEQRMHERKLADLEEEGRRIQEAQRRTSTFLADMSHELRTPLNAIIGFAELMTGDRDLLPSDTGQRYMNYILSSSLHLLHLVDEVLDLVKVESGKFTFAPTWIDLPMMVGEVFDILSQMACRKRMRMESAVDSSVTRVFLDPSKLKQVLYNLVSNALKFTPDGGTVRVSVDPDGEACFRLSVEDTGIGVRPEDQGRLFREFQQLHAAARSSGTGLGLALTRRIVEAQGGTVGVRSVPGQGSCFHAVLPRVAVHLPAASTSVVPQEVEAPVPVSLVAAQPTVSAPAEMWPPRPHDSPGSRRARTINGRRRSRPAVG